MTGAWAQLLAQRRGGRYVDLAGGRDDHAPVALLAPDAERALVGHAGGNMAAARRTQTDTVSPMQGAA